MEQSTLTVIAVVTGFIGAVGGLFAAAAAFRSAGSAKEAVKHARDVERRGLVRDVTRAAHNVVAETMRVDDFGNKLKQAYQTLAIFSGQAGGSRPKLYITDVEEKQKAILPLQQEARKLIDEGEAYRSLAEEELTEVLTKMDGYLVQVRRVKEKFEHDLESVERDNKIFREKAIKDT